MTYYLSATKLQLFNQCPLAYYFRYECNLQGSSMFGSAALGTALHQTLAKVHGDWHYQDLYPSREWVEQCWQQHTTGLTELQMREGSAILENYYQQHIVRQTALPRPLAVEGKIQATLRLQNIEFTITGRYDRIDYFQNGLELIDYKSGRDIRYPDPQEVDLQLGLYCLALEQRYHRTLKRLTLVYLRTGEQVSFEVTPRHQKQVLAVVERMALQLRDHGEWPAQQGSHCDRCAYVRYCPALQPQPQPLPAGSRSERKLQLVLTV